MLRNQLTATLVLCMISGGLAAKTISINSKTRAEANEVTVTLTNLGDELANDVSIEVVEVGNSYTSQNPFNLAPQQTYESSFRLEDLSRPGMWVSKVLISYRDAGGYLFSAPTVFYRRSDGAAISKLSLKVDAPKTTGRRGSITVINSEGSSVTVSLELFGARELQFEPERVTVGLSPGESQTTEFEINNLTAINLSSYPFFVIAHYDLHGRQYAVAGSSTVTVRQTSARYRVLSIVSAAIVFIGGIVVARRWFLSGRNSK